MAGPLATATDLADIWRPLTSDETTQATNLIAKASARLRQRCPFDIDERIALHGTDATDPKALDPAIVADVVANIVKRVMSNPNGVVSESETVGPYTHSSMYAGRYSGAKQSNTLEVLDSDIDQLRPAQPAVMPATLRIGPGEAPSRVFEHGRTDKPRWGWGWWL